jgi:hypothetical protein
MDQSRFRWLQASKIRKAIQSESDVKKSKSSDIPHIDDFLSKWDLQDCIKIETPDPSTYIAELPAEVPYTPFEFKKLTSCHFFSQLTAPHTSVFGSSLNPADYIPSLLDSPIQEPQTCPGEDAIRNAFLPDLSAGTKAGETQKMTPVLEQQPAPVLTRNGDVPTEFESKVSATDEKQTPYGQNPVWHPDFHKMIGQLYRLNKKYSSAHSDNDSRIYALEQELSTLKAKYEALSTLYQQLHDEHSEALATVETLKRKGETFSETEKPNYKLDSASNDLEEVSERSSHATMKLAKMTDERDKALRERDAALAELRLLRTASETVTPKDISENSPQPQQVEEEEQQIQLSISAESISGVGRHYGSLSQPTGRQLVVPNENLQHQNSVLSISSNRKVQLEPKSSFEDLRC